MYHFLKPDSENCTSSPGQEGESSVASFSDIPPFVLSRLNLTPEKSSCRDSGTESCPGSQSGMMCEPSTGGLGAGKGAGIAGSRSGLWGEFKRIIREVRPKLVWVENSPMLTSRGLGVVLADLAAMGYNARWGVLGGADAGMETDGQRIWILATSSESGWKALLRNDPRGRNFKKKIRATTNDGSRSRLDRIHALEQVVGESGILGSGDGVAYRVDRLAAIGNGQVPACVELAWKTLSQGLR
jgi:hypothetical protein